MEVPLCPYQIGSGKKRKYHRAERTFGDIWGQVTFRLKHQRGEMLVLLKDNAGLKYSEIAGFEIFADLSFASFPRIAENGKTIY